MEVNRKPPEKDKKQPKNSGHRSKLSPWTFKPTAYMRPFGGRRGR